MDIVVKRILDSELDRQRRGLELIASENFTSYEVMKTMGSCLTNKYAEGYPGKRYYAGCEHVDEVELLAIDRLKQCFGVEFANVQPHSGAQANAAVFLAFLKPGDKVLGFELAHGGHLSHGSPVNYSGKVYDCSFYGVNKDTGVIDMDEVEAIASRVKPKLIICGASAYSRDWEYSRFREIADQHNALLLADIAHPAGLIASKLLNDPADHCHVITSTTHKTLRGPRGGIIMAGKDGPNPLGITTKKGTLRKLSGLINSGVFPGMQGGPLEHIIAAKAVAFGEVLEDSFNTYASQVIANAKKLSELLISMGYQIISGGTDNHLMLIDLSKTNMTGREAEQALLKADITVNKNMVPFDERSPMETSGIRIGTAAITTRGFVEKDIDHVATWIHEALSAKDSDEKLNAIKSKVNLYMEDFPLYPEIKI